MAGDTAYGSEGSRLFRLIFGVFIVYGTLYIPGMYGVRGIDVPVLFLSGVLSFGTMADVVSCEPDTVKQSMPRAAVE